MRTQSGTLGDQLNDGVRAFDIRVEYFGSGVTGPAGTRTTAPTKQV